MKARTIEPNQRLNCVNPVNMRLMNNIRPNNESHYLNVSTIIPNAELFLNGFYVILTIIIPYLHENEGKLNHKQTATSLKKNGDYYIAKSYDELADSPFILSISPN